MRSISNFNVPSRIIFNILFSMENIIGKVENIDYMHLGHVQCNTFQHGILPRIVEAILIIIPAEIYSDYNYQIKPIDQFCWMRITQLQHGPSKIWINSKQTKYKYLKIYLDTSNVAEIMYQNKIATNCTAILQKPNIQQTK